MNCTASNGKTCVFPFIYGDQVFTQCTSVYSPSGAPWCSTKVHTNGMHHSGIGEYGDCDPACPSDTAEGALPTCQTPWVDPIFNISNNYPDHCAARHASSTKNVLFIGNSFTYFHNMPDMVVSLAAAAGKTMTQTSNTPGGMHFQVGIDRLP